MFTHRSILTHIILSTQQLRIMQPLLFGDQVQAGFCPGKMFSLSWLKPWILGLARPEGIRPAQLADKS